MHVMKVVLIPRPKKAGPTLAAPKLHAKSVLGYGLFKSRARLNIYVSSKPHKEHLKHSRIRSLLNSGWLDTILGSIAFLAD